MWDVHKEQEAQASRLTEQRISVNELRLAFEKEKADFKVEQAKRELELQKREFLSERAMEQIAQQKLELSDREKAFLLESRSLQADRKLLARDQVSASMEEKIQKLMSEFSELGVNLDVNYHCLSGESLMRYNVAKGKFIQIYTLAKSNLLLGKYGEFIEQNKQKAQWYGCGR
ncbi:hypothetical protein HB13667_16180 [Pseudomonas putida]|nr:hypothetical protein HB13667_16180 [Pseudomonas putida]